MSRIYAWILSIAIFVIGLDQWTKQVALETLARQGDTRPFLGWFHFTLVHNYGAAFGMLRKLPDSIRAGFFILLPLVVLTILWFSYVRRFNTKELLGPAAIGLVVGGALGNLIDRIRHGYVIDFIDWFYPSSSNSCIPLFFNMDNMPNTCHWPVFNVADSAISIAMILLVVHSMKLDKSATA